MHEAVFVQDVDVAAIVYVDVVDLLLAYTCCNEEWARGVLIAGMQVCGLEVHVSDALS